MTEHLTGTAADLKAWLLMHRTRDLAFSAQHRILFKHGLTAEQRRPLRATGAA